MKKLLLLIGISISILSMAQVPASTITTITKKFVMIDAKADGSVINVRYDSIKVKQVTMREAIMSYLSGTLLKTKEIHNKYDDFKSSIIGNPTEEDLTRSEKYLFQVSKIGEKQKVLMFEKLDNADNTKKILIHSKALYYLKLDDDVTDGNYQSDYYFTLKGVPINNIYEYFLENID